MYTIVGADGREYGPATADQVRRWIAEGRANAQTRVRVEGSAIGVAEIMQLGESAICPKPEQCARAIRAWLAASSERGRAI